MYGLVERIARLFALLGGFALCAAIIITCLSIVGRSLNGILHSDVVEAVAPDLAAMLLRLGLGPINGDFELVEAGMAFSIFAFLPLCQLHHAHASVDIFVSKFSPAFQKWLAMLIDVVFAAVLILIAWKLGEGMMSKRASGQTTFLLQFPLWWAYGASLVAAIVAAFVGLFVAITRIIETISGRVILPVDLEHGL